MREVAFKNLGQKNLVTIAPFSQNNAVKWDDYVWQSNNGTIFHTRKFLNYHPEGRFEDASLIFKKGEKWLALLPAARSEEDGQNVLISRSGASFGGPVFNYSISLKDAFCFVESLIAYARANSYNKIILTLPPKIYHSRPSDYFDFAFLESGFTYLKREVSSVIPLDFAEEDTLLIFSPESRRAVRKAVRSGVVVRETDDIETFYAILKKNLKLRHNVQPTHTLEELIRLQQIFPERIKLFSSFLGDEMIAGVVIFVCNDKVALAFYISHREEMQKYRAVNLLFYDVIRWAIREHIKFLDFGIFTVNMKPNWGLARFKESFGAQGVFRDTFVRNI